MTVLRSTAAALAVLGAVASAVPASAADVSVRRLAGPTAVPRPPPSRPRPARRPARSPSRGATAAGVRKAPILLTASPDELGAATRALLRARPGVLRTLDVLGDATAVSDAVVQDAVRAPAG